MIAAGRTSARTATFAGLLALAVGLLLVLAATATPTATAAGAWSVSRVGTETRYMGLDFITQLQGWAVSGTEGFEAHTHAVARTADAGASWTSVALEPHSAYPDLRDVAFFSSSTGIAVGMATTVVRTIDGGVTWQSVAAANTATLHADFFDVDVVSGTRAYAAGYTYSGAGVDIVMTNDGGVTWVDRSPSQLRDATKCKLVGLDFVDAQRGWALYQNGSDELRVLQTGDGGVTWTQKVLVKDQWAFPRDLCFVDAQNGWALAGYYTYWLYRTTDGGATWTQVGTPAGCGQVWSVFFVSTTHGWMATEDTSANDTVLWRTTDGGATWAAAATGVAGYSNGMRSLDFTDANHGWAAGHMNNTSVVMKYVGTDPLPPDTTPPVTTVTGAVAGGWYRRDVALSFQADDGGFGCSGVKDITWYVDLWTWGGFAGANGTVTFPAPSDHSKDGLYEVFFYAEDIAGNREGSPDADRSIVFGIDTVKPVTVAYAASARRGTAVTLKHTVKDTPPRGPKAKTVVVKVYHSGRLVKTLKYTNKAVDTTLGARFTVPRTWKAGTYVFKVYATDNAGNAQGKVGSNKLAASSSPPSRTDINVDLCWRSQDAGREEPATRRWACRGRAAGPPYETRIDGRARPKGVGYMRPDAKAISVVLLMSVVLTLLIAASPAAAAPQEGGARAASPPNLVTRVGLQPGTPNVLKTGQRVTVSFTYQTDRIAGVRIFVRPLTGGVLTPYYGAHGSPLYAVGSGTGSGWFTITRGSQRVERIRVQMYTANQSDLLFETTLPVDYQFRSAAKMVSKVRLTATPNVLKHTQKVSVRFAYNAKSAGGVRFVVRPISGGKVTPNYAAAATWLYPPGSGTAKSWFTVKKGATTVTGVRIQMWNAARTKRLFQVTLPVSYRYQRPDNIANSITLAPGTPNILKVGEDVSLAFKYTTNEAGGVRIWARPFTGGNLTPNYGAHGSPLYPVGSGAAAGSFTITSGTVTVDEIRIQMWADGETRLLFERKIPVSYQFK